MWFVFKGIEFLPLDLPFDFFSKEWGSCIFSEFLRFSLTTWFFFQKNRFPYLSPYLAFFFSEESSSYLFHYHAFSFFFNFCFKTEFLPFAVPCDFFLRIKFLPFSLPCGLFFKSIKFFFPYLVICFQRNKVLTFWLTIWFVFKRMGFLPFALPCDYFKAMELLPFVFLWFFFQKNPVLAFVLPYDFVPFCLTLYFFKQFLPFFLLPRDFFKKNSFYLSPYLAFFFQKNQVLTFFITMRFFFIFVLKQSSYLLPYLVIFFKESWFYLFHYHVICVLKVRIKFLHYYVIWFFQK